MDPKHECAGGWGGVARLSQYDTLQLFMTSLEGCNSHISRSHTWRDMLCRGITAVLDSSACHMTTRSIITQSSYICYCSVNRVSTDAVCADFEKDQWGDQQEAESWRKTPATSQDSNSRARVLWLQPGRGTVLSMSCVLEA